MKRILSLFTMVLLTGCVHFGPNFRFPPDIKDECYGARNEARSLIEAKGTKLGRDTSVTVQKQDGEKKFSGMWCWYDGTLKCWVGGMCYISPRLIKIGCNPVTKAEIMNSVLVHEFGHYHLFNMGVYGHVPLYNDCFVNWKLSGEQQGKYYIKDLTITKEFIDDYTRKCKNGDTVGIDGFDELGHRMHIDIVVVKEE